MRAPISSCALLLALALPADGSAAVPAAGPLGDAQADRWLVALEPSALAYPEVFGPVLAEASQAGEVVILLDPEVPRSAVLELGLGAGARLAGFRFVDTPLDTFWVRDFAPVLVRRSDGRASFVDFRYDPARPRDDRAGAVLAQALRLPHRDSALDVEGGHLASDGAGLCALSTRAATDRGHQGPEAERYLRALGRALECRVLLALPALALEPTGHLDLALAFNAPREALVGQANPDDLNAPALDLMAGTLADAGVRVRRLPMPRVSDAGVVRSYLNLVPLRGRVLVPRFRDAMGLEGPVEEVLAAAYPGRRVVWVEADAIMESDGALHCVTASLP